VGKVRSKNEQTQKRRPVSKPPFATNRSGRSGAAGALGPAAGAAGTEIDSAIQFKAVHVKIHFDRLGFFQKFGIDDEFESVDVKLRIRIGKLIQSHGQARPPSTAFVEEYADGLDLFSLEVFGNLLNCRLCDLEHVTLLENKKSVRHGLRTAYPLAVSAKQLNHTH